MAEESIVMAENVSPALKAELESIQALTLEHQHGGSPATLIAVTKYASLEQVRALYHAGLRHFAENKVQDALAKQEALTANGLLDSKQFSEITWHLIGHLQSNKVNKAVGHFDWIHSVDSVALAEKIDRRAGELGLRQKILLQVNISGEESKDGFSEPELLTGLQALVSLSNIRLCGLMTIAPVDANEEVLKNVFNKLLGLLKTCRKEILSLNGSHSTWQDDFNELSMGMSQDYPVALACGATMIRVGRNLIRHI